MKTLKKLFIFTLLCLISFQFSMLTCCYGSTYNTESNYNNSSKTTFTLGETFTFDNLEFSMGTSVEFTTIDNEFSDYYECDIIKIPVTIKNIGSKSNSLSSLDFSVYSPNNKELSSVYSYFDDGLGWNTPDILPNASYIKYFYCPYENDGIYKILFGFLKTELTVEIPVQIGDNSITPSKLEYRTNETFRFNFFEIICPNIEFTKINNKYSEYYNMDVVRIPLTIKNISKESQHLNPYSCTIFGPKGVETEKVDTYFDDSCSWNSKDLTYNSSYIRAFYIIYEGDGEYTLEFKNHARTIKLIIGVNK